MSEKQTLSVWLRNKVVYHKVTTEDPEQKEEQWRHALLAEFDATDTAPYQKSTPSKVSNSPLELHHLLLMMPVGLVLFVLGWLFGSHTISQELIAGISPWVWVGISIFSSVGYWLWHGQTMIWRR